MNQGLLLSVIIPIYNGADTIVHCLDSLIAIPHAQERIEIIVVNDGSTDDTLRVLEEYKGSHQASFIRVISQANQGQSVARNKGLELAQGAYVWFVDADDWIDPETADYLLSLVTTKVYDMLCFGVRNVVDNAIEGSSVESWLDTSVSDFDTLRDVDGTTLLMNYNLSGSVWNILWRRALLSEHRAHFLEGFLHEDALFYWHYTAYAQRILLVPKVGYYYYQRRDSTIHNPQTLRVRIRSRLEGACVLIRYAEYIKPLRTFYLRQASIYYRLGLRMQARYGQISALKAYTERIEQAGHYKLLMQHTTLLGRPLLYLAHHIPWLFGVIVHILPPVA